MTTQMAMTGPIDFAYDRAFEAHWSDAFRFALAWTNDWAEAEYLVREADLRLWNHRAQLDWDRPVLPWLLVTTRRFVATPGSPIDTTVPPGSGPGMPALLDMHPWAH